MNCSSKDLSIVYELLKLARDHLDSGGRAYRATVCDDDYDYINLSLQVLLCLYFTRHAIHDSHPRINPGLKISDNFLKWIAFCFFLLLRFCLRSIGFWTCLWRFKQHLEVEMARCGINLKPVDYQSRLLLFCTMETYKLLLW